MNLHKTRERQQGVITIFVAMLMLILVTGLVMSALAMSSYNLKAVGNVQVREEAVAAARIEIEKVIGSPFTDDPAAVANNALGVDIDNDTVDDYLVNIQAPICERALRADVQATSSVQLIGFTPGGFYNTVWAIRGTATDLVSGANVTVVQRVRVLLSEVEKETVCA